MSPRAVAAQANEIGNRPALPCSLPFEHADRCGMSTRLAIILSVLPSLITGKKTPAVIADEAYAITDAILTREALR
jgi:hypothetical protein